MNDLSDLELLEKLVEKFVKELDQDLEQLKETGGIFFEFLKEKYKEFSGETLEHLKTIAVLFVVENCKKKKWLKEVVHADRNFTRYCHDLELVKVALQEEYKTLYSFKETVHADRNYTRDCHDLELVQAALQEEYRRLYPDGIPPY